jgi:hypothetical protein
MLLIAAGTGLITVYVEHHSGGAVGREFSVPYLDRLVVSGRSFWFYLGKLLYPHPLSFIYERWEIDPRRVTSWLYPASTALLLAGLYAFRGRIGKGPLVAILHYYLGTSGLIFLVVTYMTRYTYVSDHWQYFGLSSPRGRTEAPGAGRSAGRGAPGAHGQDGSGIYSCAHHRAFPLNGSGRRSRDGEEIPIQGLAQ